MKRFIALSSAEMTRAKSDGDLIVTMAFSSEEPVERWWGIEILDHSETSIRLDRLNDRAAVLFNHRPGNVPSDLIGTHEPGTIKVDNDRVLRGNVRITAATQQGRDAIGLIESRVLTKASIGYRVHKVVEQTTKRGGMKVERVIDGPVFERAVEQHEAERKTDRGIFLRALDAVAGAVERAEDDEPVFRIMDWEPIENSLVTVPADNSVGLGRTDKEQHRARTGRDPDHPAVSATTRTICAARTSPGR